MTGPKEEFIITIKPRFRDLDTFGHVNNAVFVTYLEIARVDWFLEVGYRKHPKDFQIIIAHIEVDYLHPIELNADLQILLSVSRIGSKSWTFSYVLQDKQTQVVYAKAQTVQVAFDYEKSETVLIPETLGVILERFQHHQGDE